MLLLRINHPILPNYKKYNRLQFEYLVRMIILKAYTMDLEENILSMSTAFNRTNFVFDSLILEVIMPNE